MSTMELVASMTVVDDSDIIAENLRFWCISTCPGPVLWWRS